MRAGTRARAADCAVHGGGSKVADAVADHLGLFDEVIASNGSDNIRGERKAEELCRRFGERGFVYAGNDSTDHAVWRHAAGAVVVNASSAVARSRFRPSYKVLAMIDDGASQARAALRALRPYQWLKNLFTLVPMLAAGDFANGVAWRHSLAIMAAFCATASAIYLINDLSDLAADRAHPRKRRRPFASGALPVATGLAMVPLLFVLGAWLSVASGAWVALAVYAALSLGLHDPVEGAAADRRIHTRRALHHPIVWRRRGKWSSGVDVAAGVLVVPVP